MANRILVALIVLVVMTVCLHFLVAGLAAFLPFAIVLIVFMLIARRIF